MKKTIILILIILINNLTYSQKNDDIMVLLSTKEIITKNFPNCEMKKNEDGERYLTFKYKNIIVDAYLNNNDVCYRQTIFTDKKNFPVFYEYISNLDYAIKYDNSTYYVIIDEFVMKIIMAIIENYFVTDMTIIQSLKFNSTYKIQNE